MYRRNFFLEQALDVGNDLVRQAKLDSKGVFWINITNVYSRHYVVKKANASIGDGTAGVLLFLIELYRNTNSEEYLQLIKHGADWLTHNHSKVSNHGTLFAGRLGIALVLLKCHEITGEQRYLDTAFYIAKETEILRHSSSCFLYGISGALMVFLHLYIHSKTSWLSGKIEECLIQLARSSVLTSSGIYWNITSKLHEPIGCFEGTSGVALALLELSHYFRSFSLFQIVRETAKLNIKAFTLRQTKLMSQFNIFSFHETRKSLRKQQESLLGILAVAIKMCEYFPNQNDGQQMVNWAIEQMKITYSKSNRSQSLCDNFVWKLFLLQYGQQILNLNDRGSFTEEDHDFIANIKKENIRKGYHAFQFDVEDYGLLKGSTGWGLACIQIFNGNFMPLVSTGLPKGDRSIRGADLTCSIDSLMQSICQSKFSRTIKMLRIINGTSLVAFESKDMNAMVIELSKRVKTAGSNILNEIFLFEKSILELESRVFPAPDTYEDSFQVRPKVESDTGLKNELLKLSEQSILCKTKWNWDHDRRIEDNVQASPSEHYYITGFTGTEMIERRVDFDAYFVMNMLRNATRTSQVLKNIRKHYKGRFDMTRLAGIEVKCLETIRVFRRIGLVKIA